MAGHYLIGRSRSAGWAWFLSLFALVLLPLSIVMFRLRLIDQPTLPWSLALAGAVGALGILAALFSILSIWLSGARGGGRAVAALALGGLIAVPFGGAGYLFSLNPVGNFAETTGMNGPSVDASVSSSVAPVREPLVGRDFRATAAVVYGAARTALVGGGMTIVDVTSSAVTQPQGSNLGVSGTVLVPIPTLRDSLPTGENAKSEADPYADLDADDYTIQAVATAPLFAFPSDVTVRIIEDNGATYVDVRSVSETLTHDFGLNQRVIQSFFGRLDEAMKVLEGVVPEA